MKYIKAQKKRVATDGLVAIIANSQGIKLLNYIIITITKLNYKLKLQ